MKKFTKICLILAAVFTVIGLGVLGSGVALGASSGSIERELSGNHLWNKVSGQFYDNWHGNWFDDDEDWDYDDFEDYEEDGYETYVFSDIETLKVDVKRSAIYVEESEDAKLRVAVNDISDHHPVKVKNSGNEVSIASESREDRDSEIYIYLPEDKKMKYIQINCGGSYMTLDDIKTQRLDVTLGAGELETDGSIEADLTNLSVGAGAIYATMEESKEDYNYSVTCGAGSVDIEGDDYSGIASEKKIENDNARYKLNVECGVGVVELDFEK